MLDKPDIRGRLAILEVHARGKPLANDASLMDLARQTVGFSGADLANLLNEAALLAARRHQDVICKPELEEAILRIMAVAARKQPCLTPGKKDVGRGCATRPPRGEPAPLEERPTHKT